VLSDRHLHFDRLDPIDDIRSFRGVRGLYLGDGGRLDDQICSLMLHRGSEILFWTRHIDGPGLSAIV